jgi:hypothetical protein
MFSGNDHRVETSWISRTRTETGRRSHRDKMEAPASVVDTATGKVYNQGMTVDWSEHGVRFHGGLSTLTPGQIVEVVLTGELSRTVRSLVIWIGSLESRHLGEVGLEFLVPQLA